MNHDTNDREPGFPDELAAATDDWFAQQVDGAPIVGEAPGAPGFYNAVTSNGYTLAPAVGRITADLVVRGRTDMDISPYRLDRFPS